MDAKDTCNQNRDTGCDEVLLGWRTSRHHLQSCNRDQRAEQEHHAHRAKRIQTRDNKDGTEGSAGEHLVAFARHRATATALTVVPRLGAALTEGGARLPLGREIWGETWILLPPELPQGPYLNLFTGTRLTATRTVHGPALAAGDLLDVFPVALLDLLPGVEAPGEPPGPMAESAQAERSDHQDGGAANG